MILKTLVAFRRVDVAAQVVAFAMVITTFWLDSTIVTKPIPWYFGLSLTVIHIISWAANLLALAPHRSNKTRKFLNISFAIVVVVGTLAYTFGDDGYNVLFIYLYSMLLVGPALGLTYFINSVKELNAWKKELWNIEATPTNRRVVI